MLSEAASDMARVSEGMTGTFEQCLDRGFDYERSLRNFLLDREEAVGEVLDGGVVERDTIERDEWEREMLEGEVVERGVPEESAARRRARAIAWATVQGRLRSAQRVRVSERRTRPRGCEPEESHGNLEGAQMGRRSVQTTREEQHGTEEERQADSKERDHEDGPADPEARKRTTSNAQFSPPLSMWRRARRRAELQESLERAADFRETRRRLGLERENPACVACMERFPESQMTKMSCGHHYCHKDLQSKTSPGPADDDTADAPQQRSRSRARTGNRSNAASRRYQRVACRPA